MADHKKVTAQQAIKEKRSENDKYSPETLKANMSTGGGTPIEKGHKWTTEHRVLQPRDPDTGHFTFNADADLSLKYKSHGKGNADPISYKQFGLNKDVKKGDVVNIGGKTWIAIEDIPVEKLRDFFRHYDPETGEYYSSKEDMPTPDKATIEDAFDKIKDTVHDAVKLSDLFVKKRGKMSKAEKAGVEQGEQILGQIDVETLGKYSKAEMAQKLESAKKGFTPGAALDKDIAPISDEKKAANEEFNKKYDESLTQMAQQAFAFNGMGGGTPSTPQSAPNPTPAPEEKTEVKETVEETVKPAKPTEKPNKGPKGLYDSHNYIIAAKVNYKDPEQKEYFDKLSADINRDPKKYNCTPEQAKALTGPTIAHLASKGAFAKLKFDF